MTTDEIRKECERLFQAGGPRVYTWDEKHERLRPCNISGKRAAAEYQGEVQVWARRKQYGSGRYEWVRVTA